MEVKSARSKSWEILQDNQPNLLQICCREERGGAYKREGTRECSTVQNGLCWITIRTNCSCQVTLVLTLCDPMDCSPPGSSVHGILQARTLEWVAISFSRRSSRPRARTKGSCGSCITGRFFTFWATREAQHQIGQFKKKKKISLYNTALFWIILRIFKILDLFPQSPFRHLEMNF